MPGSPRAALRFFVRAAIFLLVAAGLLEVLFRTALPARESPIPLQEPTEQLSCYDPQVPTGLFTSGRLAEQRARWRINPQCWNAGVPYLPAAERDLPLVAFVGDSQWEGLYVDWPENVAAQVGARLGVAGYSFSGSGYRISHYARVARHLAVKGYAPRTLVLYINRGDYWSAIVDLGGRLGGRNGQQIAYDPERQTFVELAGQPYRTTRLRRLLRESALVRYAVFNAGVNPLQPAAAQAEEAMTDRVTYPESQPEAAPLIERSTDWLLDQIAAALPETEVVFVIDADRRAIARGERPPNRLGASAIVERVCARRGCRFLDLTAAFTAAVDRTGEPLSFAHNYHWNAHGHAVAAEAIAALLKTPR